MHSNLLLYLEDENGEKDFYVYSVTTDSVVSKFITIILDEEDFLVKEVEEEDPYTDILYQYFGENSPYIYYAIGAVGILSLIIAKITTSKNKKKS